VPVPQRHVVDGAGGERLLEPGQADHGRIVRVRGEGIHRPVPHHHPHGAVRRQPGDGVTHQVPQGPLREPRRRHELDPVPHPQHPGLLQHHHVPRLRLPEHGGPVHRGRVERVVVPRQQVHRAGHACERVERAPHRPLRDHVGLEHVPRHHHELAGLATRHVPEGPDRVDPGGRVPGLRLALQEVASHPELPVARVQEPHRRHRTPPPATTGMATPSL